MRKSCLRNLLQVLDTTSLLAMGGQISGKECSACLQLHALTEVKFHIYLGAYEILLKIQSHKMKFSKRFSAFKIFKFTLKQMKYLLKIQSMQNVAGKYNEQILTLSLLS